MKVETKLKLEIINTNSLASLRNKVNQFFDKHIIKSVEYQKGDIEVTAFIHYEQEVKIPENVKDEYVLRGDFFYCEQCPKWGANYTGDHKDAFKCHNDITHKAVRGVNPACLWFYESLARGDIRPYDKTYNEP